MYLAFVSQDTLPQDFRQVCYAGAQSGQHAFCLRVHEPAAPTSAPH